MRSRLFFEPSRDLFTRWYLNRPLYETIYNHARYAKNTLFGGLRESGHLPHLFSDFRMLFNVLKGTASLDLSGTVA